MLFNTECLLLTDKIKGRFRIMPNNQDKKKGEINSPKHSFYG